ncbi:hypothetical protein FRC15_003519 [Serendipita sp. 397]|nr:hypothetical protein FRC15_003519 [Serendipita sp. 397]
MNWETLPDEIKILIIENTDPYDISKLRQTCQRNKKLIDSSIRLNYILELARDGYSLIHDCDSVPDIARAMKQHIEWRERWKQLDLGSAALSIKASETREIRLQGDMIYSTAQNTLRSFSLSKLAQPDIMTDSSKAWESHDFDVESEETITILGGDVQQRLLVVGINDVNENCVKLHFLSIPDMVPLAESRSAHRDFDCCYSIQACGSVVLYSDEYDDDGKYKIYIRDWRSWSLKYQFDPGDGFAVPTLLNDEYFAILQVLPDERIILELHQFGTDLVVTLLLPEIEQSCNVESAGWDDPNNFSASSDRVLKKADSNFVVAALELQSPHYLLTVYLLVMDKQGLITLYDNHSHQGCHDPVTWNRWGYVARWLPITTNSSSSWTRCGSTIAIQASFDFLDAIVPQGIGRKNGFYLIQLDFGMRKPQTKDDQYLIKVPQKLYNSAFIDDVSDGLGFRVTWSPSATSQVAHDDLFMTENAFIIWNKHELNVHWMGDP